MIQANYPLGYIGNVNPISSPIETPKPVSEPTPKVEVSSPTESSEYARVTAEINKLSAQKRAGNVSPDAMTALNNRLEQLFAYRQSISTGYHAEPTITKTTTTPTTDVSKELVSKNLPQLNPQQYIQPSKVPLYVPLEPGSPNLNVPVYLQPSTTTQPVGTISAINLLALSAQPKTIAQTELQQSQTFVSQFTIPRVVVPSETVSTLAQGTVPQFSPVSPLVAYGQLVSYAQVPVERFASSVSTTQNKLLSEGDLSGFKFLEFEATVPASFAVGFARGGLELVAHPVASLKSAYTLGFGGIGEGINFLTGRPIREESLYVIPTIAESFRANPAEFVGSASIQSFVFGKLSEFGIRGTSEVLSRSPEFTSVNIREGTIDVVGAKGLTPVERIAAFIPSPYKPSFGERFALRVPKVETESSIVEGQVSLASGEITRSLGSGDYVVKYPEYNEFIVQGKQSHLLDYGVRAYHFDFADVGLEDIPRIRNVAPVTEIPSFEVVKEGVGQKTLFGTGAEGFREPEPVTIVDSSKAVQYQLVPLRSITVGESGNIVSVSSELRIKPLEQVTNVEPTSRSSTEYYSDKERFPSLVEDNFYPSGGGSSGVSKFGKSPFDNYNFGGLKRKYGGLVLVEEEVPRGRTVSNTRPVSEVPTTVRFRIPKSVSEVVPVQVEESVSGLRSVSVPIVGLVSLSKLSSISLGSQGSILSQLNVQLGEQRSIQEQRSEQLQQQQQVQLQQQLQQQQQVQLQQQLQQQQQVQESIVNSISRISSKYIEEVPPPEERFKQKRKEERKPSRGLRVEVRKRGKFQLVGSASTEEGALALGEKVVESSAAASFRIKTPEGGILNIPTPKGYVPSKRERGVIVQPREKRISSFGEKEEITFKGIQMNKVRGLKSQRFGGGLL